MAAAGLITIPSPYGSLETMERFVSSVLAKGLTIFARIDHAAGAREAGLSLRPTELLVFGTARGGTPLMEQQQTIGIDLPLKALVWEDADGKTWLSYNDPAWIAARHATTGDIAVAAMNALLMSLGRAATGPDESSQA